MVNPTTLPDRTLEQACTMVLFMALELSDKKWKLALSDGSKRRIVTIAAGDLVALGEAVAKAKARVGMPGDVSIVSCYEAGRDGFWLHRYLLHYGVANVVVDASSIEVNRRARRAKTDRVDVEQLLRLLIRYHHGEKRVWSVVHVPSVEEEDARRLHRELERLKKERTGHRNRIQALLVSQGVRVQPRHDFLERLETARLWDGSALPPDLQAEVRREEARLRAVDEQIQALEAEQAPSGGGGAALLSTSGALDAPPWSGAHERLGLCHGIFRLASISQPPGGRRACRLDPNALCQRGQCPRPRH